MYWHRCRFCLLEKGKAVKEGKDVPPQGWIYNTAFRDGIVDDYISIRGLFRLAREQFLHAASDGQQKSEDGADTDGTISDSTIPGGTIPDGAALAALAAKGNDNALAVFRQFGLDVAEAIIPFLQTFQPDGCVIGGQIAKSFPYFGEKLLAYCERKGIGIYPVSDTSRWTLMGLYEKFCREEK